MSMTFDTRWLASIFCLLALGIADSGAAQDRPLLELSAGYEYMFDFSEAESFPKGIVASVGWNIRDSLALVGEFAHSAKVFPGSVSRTGKVYTTLGGVRVGSRVFAQVLIGQLAIRTKEQQVLGTLMTTRTETAFQAGGGIGFGLIDDISVRVTGDYRQPFSNVRRFGRQIRGAASIVVGLGKR